MATANKVKCRGTASTGNPCGNWATRSVLGDGLDCCDVEKHAEQLRRAAPVAAREEPSTAPFTIEALPVHDGPAAESMADTRPPVAPSIAELDSLGADLFGTVPPDNADTLAEDFGAAPSQSAQLAQTLQGQWTPERMRIYLDMLNVRIEADGKEPMTEAEIREGCVVLAPVMQDWFGNVGAGNKYMAVLVWAALTFGTRYGAEARIVLVNVFRRITATLFRRPFVPLQDAEPDETEDAPEVAAPRRSEVVRDNGAFPVPPVVERQSRGWAL